MNTREQIPALFVELQKLWEPHQFINDFQLTRNELNGLTLYEDDDHLYLEAAVPGVKSDQIQISVEKGLVYIKAENIDEQKDKKVHFKTERSYSYRIPLPMRIDEQALPEAICKDGIVKITMAKSRACKPMKITVKS
jgi:HSP20 family protein